MNANKLADAMEIRASIRRKATSRKSVTEGANDRLADQLDQAATMLRQQQAEIEALKQSKFDANNKVNSELTDEEINKVLESFKFPAEYVNPYDFARAILRKAQEK